MVIDKKGKLFGKVSILDLIVLFVIIVAIAGCIYKFGPGNNGVAIGSGGNDTLNVVLKTDILRQYSVDAVEVGDVFYEVHGDVIGTVVDIRVEEGRGIFETYDGDRRYVPVENRFNLYITLECSGNVTEDGYFINGNRQLSNGNTLTVESTHVTLSECRVDSVAEVQN